jgi:hypothetical protein
LLDLKDGHYKTGVSSKINQGIKITGIGCDEDQSGF